MLNTLLKLQTSNIPHIQFKAIVHQRLDVETLSRHNLRDILIRQLLKDGGLSGVIQTQNQKSSFLVGLHCEKTTKKKHVRPSTQLNVGKMSLPS